MSRECAHIVIIDDNPLDQVLVQMALKAANFPFEAALFADGEEALGYLFRSAESKPVDLVILDLILPKVDGREVLAALHGSKGLASVPVIVVTALLHDLDLPNGVYLRKPGNGSELQKFEEVLVETCEALTGLRSKRLSQAAEISR